MVRTRILQNLTAFFCALGLSGWLLSTPAFGTTTSERYVAQVKANNRLVFKNAYGAAVLHAGEGDVTLELEFTNAQRFSPEQVAIVLNGLFCSAEPRRMHNSGHWVEEGGSLKLIFEVDRLSFGNAEKFRDKVRSIALHRGDVTLDIRSPFAVKSAALVFFKHTSPKVKPSVVIQSVDPAGPVIRVPNITFRFNSPQGVNRFECKEKDDDNKYEPCTSPKSFSALDNGEHRFRFRAIGPDGHAGPATHYSVWVDAPKPGVTITKVVPSENPTTSQTIAITFQRNGGSGSDGFQCRLDDGGWANCRSPVSYKNLSAGEHRVSLRRLNWIYQFSLSWWLAKFRWFRILCPAYSDPVVYTWTINRDVPAAEFVVTPPVLTNSAEARFEFRSDRPASFRCRLDNGSEADCTSPFTTSVAEGQHDFHVTPFIGAQVGATIHYHWAVDRTGPELTLGTVSPPQALTSSAALSLTFTSSEAATFQCSLNGAALTACASPVNVAGLSDGGQTLSIIGTDAAGNSGARLEYAWTVDQTVPGAVVRLLFPTQSPSGETRATLELTPSETVSFTCVLDGGAAFACANPLELTGLADGRHELSAVARDGAGNVSAPASVQWEVDTTAPVVTVGQVTPPENPTESRSIEVGFDLSEAASVTCELDLGGQVPCTSPVTATGLADGNHRFEIIAVDAAGNVSVAVHHDWQVRTTATVSITAVSPEGQTVSQHSLAVEFGSTNAVSFVCSLDGAASQACTSPASLTGLVDGAHVFEVRGLNLFGDAGPAAVHNWSVDTTGPVVTFQSVSPSDTVTASPSLTAAFSSGDAATYLCSLDAAPEALCSSPFSVAGLADGPHQISVVGVDSFGNRGTAATHSWEVDATGPAIVFGAINPAGTTVPDLSLSAAFSASELATFRCRLDGGADYGCSSPVSVIVGEGAHSLSVVGTDGLGNVGEAVTHNWTVAVPDVAAVLDGFTPSTSPASVNSATAVFSGALAASFVCSLDGAAFAACASPQSYTGLSDGAHTFAVAALNAVNRRGPSATRSWSIDTTGPVVQITGTNPAGSPTSALSLMAFFSANETATFRCRLDGGSESVCASPYTVSVGEGSHQLSVYGVDALGNVGAATSYLWVVSVPAATVTLTSIVPSTNLMTSRNIAVSFSGTNATSFECSLDGAAYLACSSPFSASGLADGAHTIQVRGINAVGQAGAAAYHSWLVDNVGPQVSILSVTPDWSPTSQTSLTATFEATEVGASFLCALDGALESSCTSPHTFTGLADGPHSFAITALDTLGNRGVPVTYSWVVDTSALVIGNVSVSNVTVNSAVLQWTTNLPSTSQVLYGVGATINQATAVNGSLVTAHSVTVTGLSSFTFYSVQAKSVDRDGRVVQSSVVTFRTLRP